MVPAVEQRFPIRRGDEVAHAKWSVDLEAAAHSAQIPVGRLGREAVEMAEHFPRWLLTLVRDGQPVSCKCSGLYVFDRGVRCVQCGDRPQPTAVARAGWFGVLPPIGIDGLARIKDAVVARPPRRHVVGTRAPIGTYLLVPLVAMYPGGYPRNPVDVYYLPEFRDLAGIPRGEFSHEFHMIGIGRMCLFAPGDWHDGMTCREVLQQRAYPHAVKFLNYANGKRNAFAIVS